jgi:hypothetical protein
VHETAVADGGEQEWESKIEAEDASAQVAIGERDGMARAKSNVLVHTAIFAEGDFAFGAAIKVVEDGSGNAAFGDGAEVCDADHVGRGDGAGRSSHSVTPVSGVR